MNTRCWKAFCSGRCATQKKKTSLSQRMHLLDFHYSRLFCAATPPFPPFPLFAPLTHSPLLHQMSGPFPLPNHSRQSRHSRHPWTLKERRALPGPDCIFPATPHYTRTPIKHRLRHVNHIFETLKTHILTDKFPPLDNTVFAGYICGACHTNTHSL